MGNAAIWWRPTGADVVRKIDLGGPLSDLQELPEDRLEVVEETTGGKLYTTRVRTRERIRVTTRPWLSYDVWDEAVALVNRLRAGGRISLAEDDATAWAAYVSDWTDPDAIILYSSPWAAYGGTVATGQRWRATSASPRVMQGGGTISGGALTWNSTAMRAGGVLIPTATPPSDWTGEPWVLVRQVGFWPCLRMPADARSQVAITHKSRRNFRLELTLEVDMHGLDAIAQTPTQLLNGTTDEGYPTMDDMIL